MFSIFKFIFNCIISFMEMLFTIEVDNGLSIGLLLCICFIFLPLMLRVINFIKQDAIEELDEKYDESRPRETWTSNERQFIRLGKGRTFTTNHTRSRSRRYRI